MPTAKQSLTPQEKKRLSLERDCRNVYGENDKSSRKAIRNRKKWGNQSYRRGIHQILSHTAEDADALMLETSSVKPQSWRKRPDMPIGEFLLDRAKCDLEHEIGIASVNDAALLDRLESWLATQDVAAPAIRAIMGHLRVVSARVLKTSQKWEIDLSTIRLIFAFLKQTGVPLRKSPPKLRAKTRQAKEA